MTDVPFAAVSGDALAAYIALDPHGFVDDAECPLLAHRDVSL
jgi:hypothetical protein